MSIQCGQEIYTKNYDTTSLDTDGLDDKTEQAAMSDGLSIQIGKSYVIENDQYGMTDLNLIHNNFYHPHLTIDVR